MNTICQGYNREDEFIATQGPLPATRKDMWRMVWERQVPMIIMLTQIVERGRVRTIYLNDLD